MKRGDVVGWLGEVCDTDSMNEIMSSYLLLIDGVERIGALGRRSGCLVTQAGFGD
jgi:hypothetical protein